MSDIYRRCMGSKQAVEQAMRFTRVASMCHHTTASPKIETLNSVMASDRYLYVCKQELKKRLLIHRANLKLLKEAGADAGLLKALMPDVSEAIEKKPSTLKEVVGIRSKAG